MILNRVSGWTVGKYSDKDVCRSRVLTVAGVCVTSAAARMVWQDEEMLPGTFVCASTAPDCEGSSSKYPGEVQDKNDA